MVSLSPLQIALLVVGALALFGFVAILVGRRRTFSGYEQIADDARVLANALKGESFRDGDDLVISGNYNQLPAVVRFSNADNTPGLNIRVQVPSTFSLSVTPADGVVAGGAGRALGRTNDAAFDARFVMRSNQPAEARMFMSPRTMAWLKRLCCSSRTYVSMTPGAIEVTEMVIPPTDTSHHIVEHLKQISALAEALRSMPGAEAVKVVPFRRERHTVTRLVIGVGAAAALVIVFTAGVPGRPQAASVPTVVSGIMPIDARLIRDLQGWRVATSEDFDPTVLNWMRGNNLPAEGRMSGDFSGKAGPTDVAYLLVSGSGGRRIVMLSEGRLQYDGEFDSLAGVVLLPKVDIDSVDWAGGRSLAEVDGDGLLVIRKPNDPASDFAVFRKAGALVFSSPTNYQRISVQR